MMIQLVCRDGTSSNSSYRNIDSGSNSISTGGGNSGVTGRAELLPQGAKEPLGPNIVIV